jgi:RimJ/RimL family protein N-acetyltransferase
MILTTQRLLIRKFTASDLEDFSTLMGDPQVMRFGSSNGALSKDASKNLFQHKVLDHYKKYGFGTWALVLKEKNLFIGYAGLVSQIVDGKEAIELGYRLFPAYWGKGFATEAARSICSYAFHGLGLRQLISIMDAENLKSIKVAEKTGMHFLKNSVFHGSQVLIYQIVAD